MKELAKTIRYFLQTYQYVSHSDFLTAAQLIKCVANVYEGIGYIGAVDSYGDEISDSSDIKDIIGATPLDIRRAIHQLRMEGEPIIASSKGYRLANDNQELQEYIAKRGAEIGREWAALKAMAIKSGKEPEQLVLFDVEME